MQGANTGPSGPGHYSKQTFVSSTKKGPDGRMIKEEYQSKAQSAVGQNGEKVGERQQAYHNTGTGLGKVSHERMLNGQGRKVVKERLSDQ